MGPLRDAGNRRIIGTHMADVAIRTDHRLPLARKRLLGRIQRHKYLYILLVPGLIQLIIFSYLPLYGITLAFKEFSFARGILGSPWVGLLHFHRILGDRNILGVIWNTIAISFGRLVFTMPVPIVLALMLNEIKSSKLKRFHQTVYTLPYFLSWVILYGIIFNFLADNGVLNQVLRALGRDRVNLLTNVPFFRPLIYITANWKDAGWGSIIYLAAIAGINPELYEAATIDGANRFQKMRNITWPGMQTTVVIILLLTIGNLMNAGFDQIFNLYNPIVFPVADILDTYIYRATFVQGQSWGLSTAVGVFKSVTNFALLFAANFTIKRLGAEGLF
jgi:putative aldouronate transport system permease protein